MAGRVYTNTEMRVTLILIFIFILSGIRLFGQIELSRQVIGSMGSSVVINDSISISATVGEAVITSLSSEAVTLTQGFHQPGFKGFLSFDISTTFTSCPTSTDGTATIQNLVGCRGPYQIQWSNGSETTSAEDLSPGFYSVTVTTPDCAFTQEFEIFTAPDVNCDLRFFNAFSPNGDGTNDVWEIENIENDMYRNNNVEIFNRWGQSIWQGDTYDNTNVVWDGNQSNGNQLPDATYFYIATVNDKVYKGYIELTR